MNLNSLEDAYKKDWGTNKDFSEPKFQKAIQDVITANFPTQKKEAFEKLKNEIIVDKSKTANKKTNQLEGLQAIAEKCGVKLDINTINMNNNHLYNQQKNNSSVSRTRM